MRKYGPVFLLCSHRIYLFEALSVHETFLFQHAEYLDFAVIIQSINFSNRC